jgi:CxxC motif-containing protein
VREDWNTQSKNITPLREYLQRQFLPLVPVRSNKPILKDKLRDALNEIAQAEVKAPIKMGAVLIENILELDVNIIASRDLGKY